MSLGRRLADRLRGEAGVAATGAALIVGGFVVAGSVVGGVVLSSGLAGSEQLDATMQRALTGVTTGVQVDGPVIARTDGARATTLLVDVTTTAGGGAVSLAPDDPGALRARFISADAVADVPYAVSWVSGSGDTLDPGEVAELRIDVSGIEPPVGRNARFTLQLAPGDGAPATLSRTMPAGRPLDPVVNLW